MQNHTGRAIRKTRTLFCMLLLMLVQHAHPQSETDNSSCPVTLPPVDDSAWYQGRYAHHNEVLGVYLYATGSRTIGQAGAWLQKDGYIHSKYGWLKKIAGKLTIEGERLDGEINRPFRASVNDPSELAGEKPGGFLFPDPGCWKITGTLAGRELTFVIEIKEPG